MNECIPKQTMYNSASNNKAWVSRSEMGHSSPFRICLLSRGQILGCVWPVPSWRSPAASALPELSHSIPEIPFVSQHLDGSVFLPSFYLRSWYRAIESKGSAVCSSKKNCFGSFWIEIHDVLHHKCLVTWILWIGRDWGSEPRRFWYLICRKENKSCFNQISLYPGWIIFL